MRGSRAWAYRHPNASIFSRAPSASPTSRSLQQALARYEEIRGTNAVFLQVERVLLFGAIGIGLIAIRVPWLALAIIILAILGIAYRLTLSSRGR